MAGSKRVRIRKELSPPLDLTSGVPQGGILSPIMYTIYGADLGLWLQNSTVINYADDTSSGCKNKSAKKNAYFSYHAHFSFIKVFYLRDLNKYIHTYTPSHYGTM